MSARSVATALACALALSGCSDAREERAASTPAEVTLLRLSQPILEIGSVDGPDEYIFGAIASIVRLTDGSIAVADPLATSVSVYDPDGRFMRRWGREGDGPGEIRRLSRMYSGTADSVMLAHGGDTRLTVFSALGEAGRSFPPSEVSGDTLFAADSWLHGRFWVDGALESEGRARVREALDRVPPPRGAPGYRPVLVDGSGRLWIREPGGDADVEWTRLSAAGTPEATVALPRSFQPLRIDGDELLGIWTDENDVPFVRGYSVEETDEHRPTPAWMVAGGGAWERLEVDESELMATIVGSIKSMASHQEMHYASNFSYTTELDALEGFEPPEGLHVDFVTGNARGWSAVFALDGVDRLCGLAYGFDLPPGWTPGRVACAPEAPSSAHEGADVTEERARAPAEGG